ncbi:DNA polymerase eta [Agrilus planipennis]|uniref:DNA polymerase eta n=1 Tax=Agrilus planipennis TaxID=224129 RepID=A0A1W4XIR9_AGRPL|nr:DNA polymerase eta [Agrilus planipennis]
MRGDEAKEKCPDVHLVRVPVLRGKADLTKYRIAGKQVANVLLKFTNTLERASVDEAYLDITDNINNVLLNCEITTEVLKNTHVVESTVEDFLHNIRYNLTDDNLKLAVGGMIAEEIRNAVYTETGYRCSAGIAHNKILAKLACGLHKPNQQTILPQNSVSNFFNKLPICKIRSLGGKFGDAVTDDLGIKTVGELCKFSKKELTERYDEKAGSWLYNIARGINFEPVTARLIPKSIGCCKQFRGKSALFTEQDVRKWLHELAEELIERLESDCEENARKAKGLTVSFQCKENTKSVHGSRVHVLTVYEIDKVANDAYEIIRKNCMKSDGSFHIQFLGLSGGKFEKIKNTVSIKSFFKAQEHFQKEKRNSFDKIEHLSNVNIKKQEDKVTEKNTNIQLWLSSYQNVINEDVTKTDDKHSNNFEEPQEKNKSANKSDDSINNELVEILNDTQNNVKDPDKASFFDKYFNTVHGKRSFDTSRYLNEDKKLLESDEFDSDTKTEPSDEEDSYACNQEELSKTCDKCGEQIKMSEFTLHSDYHVALSLAEQEIFDNQNARISSAKNSNKTVYNSQNNKIFSAKSVKRRSPEITKNASISKYFKKEIEATTSKSGNIETCPQCNKAIESLEMESHLDYHLAKKIHSEINPMTVDVKESKRDINKSNKKKPKVQSVISFFKQPV